MIDDRTDYAIKANLLQRARAIRAKCLDCTGNQSREIKLCPVTKCALYPWRMGKLQYNVPQSPE